MKRRRILIVGAGGHAREVAEILLACSRFGEDLEPIGFVDDGPERMLNGLPVLGDMGWLDGVDRDDVEIICAVGTPSQCAFVAGRVKDMGFRIARAIAPSAWVAISAQVGDGSMIFPNAVINANAWLGDHVSLNVAASVSHDTRVGRFCSIGPGARLAGNVRLGEGCFVGMGASVLHGVTIGARSVIGAGAVVLRDLPPAVTAVGIPAKIIGAASERPMARPGMPATSVDP
jgi:sugar O-acyltransferase (sialic acid O-acetyltransferase NeuD family)